MMPEARAYAHTARRLAVKLRPLAWLPATALLALYEFRTTIPSFRNSDDASNFLAGVEMAEGNWRLHGWIMAVDNYYPTDVLLQAVLRLLFGLHPLFMQAAESAIWAAIAVLGTGMALRGSAGAPPLARIGILALALALLVFNVFERQFRDVFLTSVASHGFTILLTLLAFILATHEDTVAASRPQRQIWQRMLPLGVVVTVGSFADPIFVVIACLPLLATGLLELGPPWSRRRALIRIGTTIAAVALARGLLALSIRNDGFDITQVSLQLATFPELCSHLAFAAESITRLLGAEFYGRPVQLDGKVGINLLRAPLALAFLIACWEVGRDTVQRAREWPLPGRPDADLDCLLWVSVVVNIASTVMTTVIQDPTCARFFLPAAVTGSILIARRLGRVPLAGLYGVVVLLASTIVAVLGIPPGTPASTIAIPQVEILTDTLRRNGLRHGYAGYWEGPIVTVLSRREITSLAMVGGDDGRLHSFNWFCNLDWYRDAARRWSGPIFVVVSLHAEGLELSQEMAVRTLGPPLRTIPTDGFLIDVYDVLPGALGELRP